MKFGWGFFWKRFSTWCEAEFGGVSEELGGFPGGLHSAGLFFLKSFFWDVFEELGGGVGLGFAVEKAISGI